KIKAEACHESAGRQPLRVFQQGMPRWIRTVEAQAMPVGLGLLRQNDASDARLLRCNIEFGGTLQQTAAAHIKKARIGILRAAFATETTCRARAFRDQSEYRCGGFPGSANRIAAEAR